jgi:hypothetical protein
MKDYSPNYQPDDDDDEDGEDEHSEFEDGLTIKTPDGEQFSTPALNRSSQSALKKQSGSSSLGQGSISVPKAAQDQNRKTSLVALMNLVNRQRTKSSDSDLMHHQIYKR